MEDGTFEILSIAKIKAGEEITISYGDGYFGMRKSEARQKFLLQRFGFNCLCDFCKDETSTTGDFEDLIEEIQSLRDERRIGQRTVNTFFKL